MLNKCSKLEKIFEEVKNCSKCELCKLRNKPVFSDGNFDAKIMLIGEAPGADEDSIGVPFIGRAGKLLTDFLLEVGIKRDKDIYICNTVKCRPPNNRVPFNDEKEKCFYYLKSQIDIVKPKLILLCGATAMKTFIKTKETITKIRGELFDYDNGIKLMPIFHPSYLLRNHSLAENKPRWYMKKDLLKAKKYVENF